jgi:putative transposase
MEEAQSLNHTKWECKYHVVWIPKCRKKILYGQIKKDLVVVLRELAIRKESEILEGRLMVDHVHMLISIPPKYGVAQVVGFMKGKSAIWIARMMGRQRNFMGQNFWARGYYVSTVGLEEKALREYIAAQEEADRKLEQMRLFD